jgi:hypothetical protein
MKKPTTYFKQTPIEVVKKIVEGVSNNDKVGVDHVVVEPASRKTRPRRVRAESPFRKRF